MSADTRQQPVPRLPSSAIAAHAFPRHVDGLDPAAVYAWLTAVAEAHEILEDEIGHVREQRDLLVATLHRNRMRPSSAAVRSALALNRLPRRLLGYGRDAVDRLLDAAAVELARLENEIAVLDSRLRDRSSGNRLGFGEPREIVLP